MTQSVTSLATQPEEQSGDTARKTTWRHNQKNNLATQPEKQPGDTARKTTWRHSQKNNLATQPEKQPSPDLAGWQHIMGWRPPSPGIGDRMAPLHKLASLRTRCKTSKNVISQNSGLEAQKQARGHLLPKLATDGASPKFITHTLPDSTQLTT